MQRQYSLLSSGGTSVYTQTFRDVTHAPRTASSLLQVDVGAKLGVQLLLELCQRVPDAGELLVDSTHLLGDRVLLLLEQLVCLILVALKVALAERIPVPTRAIGA